MSEDGGATVTIAAAHTRTQAAGSARIEMIIEYTFEMPPTPKRWWGGLMRPVNSVAKAAGKRLFKAVTGNVDFRRQSSEGVIDIPGRRWMLDYGSYARLYADGNEWDGRSGRLLSTLPPNRQELPNPQWLLDILAELSEATEEGAEDVRGTVCRRFSATVGVGRASQLTPGGADIPDQAVTIEVCLDNEHLRRVRFLPEHRKETLELWDFGVSLDDLDWSRLPTFRSPEETGAR